jgi:hypothetical protein
MDEGVLMAPMMIKMKSRYKMQPEYHASQRPPPTILTVNCWFSRGRGKPPVNDPVAKDCVTAQGDSN